jgi:putative transposase
MPLRRSLACTNAIENMMGTVRRVSRNVKRWRNAAMALRGTCWKRASASVVEAHKYLSMLRAALAAHQSKQVTQRVKRNADAAEHLPWQRLLRLFQQNPGHYPHVA